MSSLLRLLPGLGLATLLAGAALHLATLPFFHDQLHFGALLLVILIGMLLRLFMELPAWAIPGIETAKKPILRWAVAGLGLRLTLGEILDIGAPALFVVSLSTLLALVGGWAIARRFGLARDLGILLGVGGAICGASAIVAADTVVQGRKQDSAMAIGVITLLGTLGILIYPELGFLFELTDFQFGVWAGASLHETAQVVAAGDSFSPEAKDVATVVKLVRIAWLAPIIFWLSRKATTEGKASVPLVPWFLVMFLIFAAVRSLDLLPHQGLLGLPHWMTANKWLMCIGMAGVGLQTNLKDLVKTGLRPVMVGGLQWLLLSTVSLLLIHLLSTP